MRLKIKVAEAKARTQKIHLSAEFVEIFDQYVKFYQDKLGSSVTVEKIIIEMLNSFVHSDRDFMKQLREKTDLHEISKLMGNP